jgi:protein-disulfide isomerase
VLVLCALIATGVMVRREFFAPPANASLLPKRNVERVDEWTSFEAAGVVFGSDSSPVVLTVFSDFECPFCRTFHQTLQNFRATSNDEVKVVFMHYPLSYHRFARAAAVAAECAAEQSRFELYADALFAKQDSLGMLSWTQIARMAHVEDLARFEECLKDPAVGRRVDSARDLGRLLAVDGTPTVLINEWRLIAPPSESDLARMLAAIRRGERPVDGSQ